MPAPPRRLGFRRTLEIPYASELGPHTRRDAASISSPPIAEDAKEWAGPAMTQRARREQLYPRRDARFVNGLLELHPVEELEIAAGLWRDVLDPGKVITPDRVGEVVDLQ